MRIFIVSRLGDKGMNDWQRAQAFRELGHDTISLPLDEYINLSYTQRAIKWLMRPTGRVFRQKDIDRFNREFIDSILKARPDIAWIDKALLLLPETLRFAKNKLPRCVFVCFQDDDPFGFRDFEKPMWSYFIEAIPFYDLCYVPKDINLADFRRHGAKKVLRYMTGFYPQLFHPLTERRNIPYIHDVSFVGTALDYRVNAISDLILKKKIPVHVCGARWNRTLVYYLKRSLFHPPCSQEAYVSMIRQSKICLGYVSHSNRDEYNGRTFEIPASGGFFLAERTPTHLELFKEGVEAEFFESTEECAEKIKFYLRHDVARQKIAGAGYLRCVTSDYSVNRRIATAMSQISEIAANK